MTGMTFDTLTRQLGRRRALQALGAAALASTSGLSLVAARNGNNGNNKRTNKQQKKKIKQQALALCEGQTQECLTLISADCNGDAQCLARGQQCCPFLDTCDFSGLLTCLQAPVEN